MPGAQPGDEQPKAMLEAGLALRRQPLHAGFRSGANGRVSVEIFPDLGFALGIGRPAAFELGLMLERRAGDEVSHRQNAGERFFRREAG